MVNYKKVKYAGIVALLMAGTLALGWYLGATSTSATPTSSALGLTALQSPSSTPAPTAAPTAVIVAGDVIPLKSLADLKGLNATVNLTANGTLNGKRAQGDLTALLATNDQNMSRIDVTGDLLGTVVAQVGGAAVSLFSPSQVSLYKEPAGTFAVVKGLFDVCVKPKQAGSTDTLDQVSPRALMSLLTGPDVARGKFVGDETMNGANVKHYVINGPAFLAAAKNSSDPTLRAFGEGLWSADDADLWVSADTGYPVAYRGNFSGLFEPLKFEGDFGVQLNVTDTNTNPSIVLPQACNNPISA